MAAGRTDPATSGGDDGQIDGGCKVAPIVASFCGEGTAAVLAAAEAAIRVTQNTDEAVAMGLVVARILESVVVGRAASTAEAVIQCIAALRDPSRQAWTLSRPGLSLLNLPRQYALTRIAYVTY